jgi:integrative and conjugative element protein (TIGR02256 family)
LDCETGGILIGFVDAKGRAIVLRATQPGPSATRSAAVFRRDVAFVQGELDRAGRELGSRGTYIGEWHSHLVPDPEPSSTDIDSLLGIADSANYLTKCPVMLIAGLNAQARAVTRVRAWAFPVGGRVYAISLQTIPAEHTDANH